MDYNEKIILILFIIIGIVLFFILPFIFFGTSEKKVKINVLCLPSGEIISIKSKNYYKLRYYISWNSKFNYMCIGDKHKPKKNSFHNIFFSFISTLPIKLKFIILYIWFNENDT